MALKQVIVVRSDLKMGKGKIAAQCAHASIEAIQKTGTAVFEGWYSNGMKMVVLRIESKKELLDLYELAKKRYPAGLVKDAGLTQVNPGEPTCIAIGPADEQDIDRITGKLRLL